MGTLTNHAGVVTFEGAIDGATLPITREEWSGNGQAQAANSFQWLPWNTSGGPDALLDATDPEHPTIITAGAYIVSVVVRTSGDGGAHFDVGLFLDRSGFNASQTVRVLADAVTGVTDDTTIAFGWYVPAGGKVEVGVDYFTSAAGGAVAALSVAHLQRFF